MGTKWNIETTIKFIQHYKSNECLWNFASKDYKHKQKRDAAYETIAKEMSIDSFGVAEVKNKIKNLRSTYSQEEKQIADSKKSGAGLDNVYVSNIEWLHEIEEVFANDLKTKTYDNIQSPSEENSSESNTQSTCADIPIASTPRPKKRSREIIKAISSLSTLHDKVNNVEKETSFDVFGKSVAMQLSNLSMENALLAQQKIQCILTEIGIQEYRDKSRATTTMSSYSNESVNSPLLLSIQCILTEIGIQEYRDKSRATTTMSSYSNESVNSPLLLSNNAETMYQLSDEVFPNEQYYPYIEEEATTEPDVI